MSSGKSGALFQVLQPRVNNFLDSAQFSALKVSHVVETFVDTFELRIDTFELRVDVRHEYGDQRRIDHGRDANRKAELVARHRPMAQPCLLWQNWQRLVQAPVLWLSRSLLKNLPGHVQQGYHRSLERRSRA